MSPKVFQDKSGDIIKCINLEDVPKHVAIIMDGNGRWAKKRHFPRIEGHRRGANNITKIVEAASNIGIKYLTVYAFSTENWQRPKDETDSLMSLFEDVIDRKTSELIKKGVKLNVLGRFDELRTSTKEKFKWSMEQTGHCDTITLNVAVNYSGRDEIIRAASKIHDLNEESLSANLDTGGMPDPELLIRTSGELRISNFLLWQLAYTELYFTPVLWPDFSTADLYEAVIDYQKRERRFGGLEKY
jgi:undecaprenyl diphosphate synthase